MKKILLWGGIVVMAVLLAALLVWIGCLIPVLREQPAPAQPEVTAPLPPPDPVKPTEIPQEPEAPAQPETPEEPEKPTEPEKPAEPEAPAEPEKPAEPEAPVEPENPAAGLQALAETFCSSHGGTWDVYVENLRTGEIGAAHTGSDPMISASTIKLFVMAKVYEQLEAGVLDRDTVKPLLESMITISDNSATNQLITLLGGGDPTAGMQAVNDYAASLGCTGTSLNRLMLAQNDLQNYTTAADCAVILRGIYRGTLVSQAASAEMLAVLQRQTVRNRIPARLPEGTSVANKTGDLIGLCVADAGIVRTDDAAWLICLLCRPDDDYRAALDMADFSLEVCNHITGTN